MEPTDWIALAGIVATALVAIVTLVVSQWTHRDQQARDDRIRREQQEREDRQRQEQQEREDEIREQERFGVPHIEFGIDCNTYGPEGDSYLAELLLTICNRGRVQQKFRNIVLRVRGIEQGAPLSYWEDNEPRLSFPGVLVDDVSVLPKGYNYFFVEPGVQQLITYVTRIPASTRFLLAHAQCEYDQFTPHTAERVFAVGAPADPLAQPAGTGKGA